MIRRRKVTKPLPIDIRDERLPNGRLTVSSRTTDHTEFLLRKSAVVALIDRGSEGLAIIGRLRAGHLRIEDVSEKVHARRIHELLAVPAEETEGPAVPPILLGVVIDRFLLRVEAKLAPSTLVEYRQFCRGMEKAFGVKRNRREKITEDVPVRTITTEQGEAWLHGVKETIDKQWSANRQNLAHAVAHQVWGLAIAVDEERHELDGSPRTLTRNIWGRSRVRPPKVRKTRVVFLDRRQAGRLLWGVKGRPEGVLMALGLYAGLRAGEARHLRTTIDVRMDRQELAIQSREGEHPWRTKRDSSTRDVPMNPALARWIGAHHRHGYAGALYLIRASQRDRPLSPQTHKRWTVAAFDKAGIVYGRDRGHGATYHTLRHTFASWLAQKDTQLMKIAALMGNSPEEVQKTYAHLLPRDLRRAVNQLSRK